MSHHSFPPAGEDLGAGDESGARPPASAPGYSITERNLTATTANSKDTKCSPETGNLSSIYVDHPLPVGNAEAIRLLTLFPGSNDQDICVGLSLTTVHNAPPYTALSYVWGDQKIRSTIFVAKPNEHAMKADKRKHIELSITRNLFNALKAIRSEDDVQTFWIDAICINQSDMVERKQQVLLMADIYKIAAKVLVWLGDADQYSELGVRATVAIASAGASLESRRSWESSRMDVPDFDTLAAGMDRAFATLPDPKTTYDAMVTLFKRPWYERVWVFQELCNARAVDVQVGPYKLLWGDLITADDVLKTVGTVTGSARPCKRAVQMDLWRASIKEGNEPDILRLLEFLQRSQSTDPRDRVFSMLGLVGDQGIRILPDYEATVAVVYGNVVTEYIRRTGYLDIVGNAWFNPYEAGDELPYWIDDKRDPELPSWTVDWRTRKLGTTLWRFIDEKNFNATNGTKAELLSDPEKTEILRLKGTVCFRVSAVVDDPLLPTKEEVENGKIRGPTSSHELARRLKVASQQLQEWIVWICGELGHTNHSKIYDPLVDAIWMTLIAGGLVTGEPLTTEHQREARLFVEENRAVLFAQGDPGRRLLQTAQEENKKSTERPRWGDVGSLIDYVRVTCGYKRLFTTEERYLGMGALGVREGDLVVLLMGGRTPFLLREREEGGHLLIGETYVHGIMNGELLKSGRVLNMEELDIS